jgi:hypothetical protein
LSDLLIRLELIERLTTEIVNVGRINSQNINYLKVDRLLQIHRKQAIEYLNNSILEGGR